MKGISAREFTNIHPEARARKLATLNAASIQSMQKCVFKQPRADSWSVRACVPKDISLHTCSYDEGTTQTSRHLIVVVFWSQQGILEVRVSIKPAQGGAKLKNSGEAGHVKGIDWLRLCLRGMRNSGRRTNLVPIAFPTPRGYLRSYV